MSELLQGTYFSQENSRLKWELAFMRTAKVPNGDAQKWVNAGVDSGIIKNNPVDRSRLARDMGRVFSVAFIEETGGQLPIEKLDFSSLSQDTKASQERYQSVARVMLEAGILHTIKGPGKNSSFI